MTTRTLYAWLAEERSPNTTNRKLLDVAYWDLRRRNALPEQLAMVREGARTTEAVHHFRCTGYAGDEAVRYGTNTRVSRALGGLCRSGVLRCR
ncbi:hypothetical protein [Streptomyces sp. NPDC059788]|uniref:hypothetical protein n=1 Tax=Streptomyces sp. NPDC059788 TaxID=3346948 RepID=UPI003657D3A9